MPGPVKELGELNKPLLVFGGPYSNLAATKKMRLLADSFGLAPNQVICTGDLVAYCSEPEATVALIQAWGCHVIMGNCEASLAANADDCGCGFEAGSACSLLSVEWYRYAVKQVPTEQKKWMSQLPVHLCFTLKNKRYRVVHGSPQQMNEFIFPSTDNGYKQQQLAAADADVIIAGHSGIPFGQELSQGHWLNAGVIGMPANDGSSDGWYMLLTPTDEGVNVSWQRLSYKVDEAVTPMEQAELCQPYAQCLADGLWPSLDVLPAPERLQTGLPLEVEAVLIR